MPISSPFLFRCLLGFCFASFFLPSLAEAGEDVGVGTAWIWRNQKQRASPAGERAWLRHRFAINTKVEKATLECAAAGAMEVYVNGKKVGASPEFRQPIKVDVTAFLEGWKTNTVAAFARTSADFNGCAVQLVLELEYGKRQVIGTSAEWKIAIDNPAGWQTGEFDDSKWENAVITGKLGDPPLGNVFAARSSATPASEITVPEGFKVELLRSASPREGSWICMTVDALGRLYISPQNAIPESGFAKESGWGGIWRATLDEAGQVARWEKVRVPIGDCMGMLWAFDSLYLSGTGPEGRAIYRCKDSNGDGDVDQWTLFKKTPDGNGEHGAHAIVKGPDGHLHILMGNATPLVDGIDPNSAARNFAEDDLLPRIKDPVATFFDGVKNPYGYVVRTDEAGKKWELVCTGMRNAYDMDYSADGELFAYDSDMEWDVGLPWYRPTAILQIMPGADYGFREGAAKMPAYYPDVTPPAVAIGLASPTGVNFGTRSNWPGKWRNCLYAMDWTYGRILAVTLRPKGIGYTGESVEFLKGKGLPVTDLEFGNDGAMYFTVGGRGTQGGLYRVSAVKPGEGAAVAARNKDSLEYLSYLRTIPKTFQPGDPWVESLMEAWKESDRNWRIAILDLLEGMGEESRENFTGILRGEPVHITSQGALAPVMLLLAARREGREVQEFLRKMVVAFLEDAEGDLVELLQEQKPKASEAEKAQDLAMLRMEVLRAYQISLIRHGGLPCDAECASRLAKFYPGADFAWNRELSQLLVAVKAPGMVGPTLDLQMQAVARWEKAGRPAPDPLQLGPQEEQIWYARVLCDAEATQFTAEQRDRYFAWFAETAPQLKGANNFIKYLESIRQRALSKLTAEEREQWEKNHQAALLARQKPSDPGNAPVRKFVKMWTLADLEGELGAVKAGRNFERGKEIFSSLLCAKCHLFNGDGRGVGPDLSAVGGRFAARDILEAITDPSKIISDQYAAIVVETKEDSHMGLIAGEDAETLTIYADAYGEAKKSIPKKTIVKREPARISLMPMGLLGSLEKEEIWDLLAYMISGGKKDAENFRPTP